MDVTHCAHAFVIIESGLAIATDEEHGDDRKHDGYDGVYRGENIRPVLSLLLHAELWVEVNLATDDQVDYHMASHIEGYNQQSEFEVVHCIFLRCLHGSIVPEKRWRLCLCRCSLNSRCHLFCSFK